MSIKGAFLRTLELQNLQRRDLMLQWCIQFEKGLATEENPSTFRILQSGIIPYIHKNSFQKIKLLERSWRLFKRDFSTSHFFSNNFEGSRDHMDISSHETQIQNATLLLENIVTRSDALLDQDPKPSSLPADFLAERREAFNFLYKNRYFSLCFDLLESIPNSPFIGFDKQDVPTLMRIIDKYGNAILLYKLAETLTSSAVLENITNVSNIVGFEEIRPIIQLHEFSVDNRLADSDSDSDICSSIIETLNTIDIQHFSFRGRHFLLSDSISSILLKSQNSAFKSSLLKMLFNQLSPDTYIIYVPLLNNIALSDRINIIKQMLADNSMTDQSTLNLLKKLFTFNKSHFEKLYIWFKVMYEPFQKDLTLDPQQIPEQVVIAKEIGLFTKTFILERKELESISTSVDSTHNFLDFLIFGFSLKSRTTMISALYALKKNINLPMNANDSAIYLKMLVKSHEYQKAFELVKVCIQDETFLNKQSFNDVFITLAETENWDMLQEQMDLQFKNDQITSADQYTVLFKCLSKRVFTNHIMTLWESYLAKGFKPNSIILSSIISSFIAKKAYSESLKWFSSYTYYDIKLGNHEYGLMLRALAGSGDMKSCLRLLEELVATKTFVLQSNSITPVLSACALLGDFQSIELIIHKYIPLQFQQRNYIWLAQAYMHSGRYGLVVDLYNEAAKKGTADYQFAMLALSASLRFETTKEFKSILEQVRLKYNKMDKYAYQLSLCAHVKAKGFKGLQSKIDDACQNLNIDCLPIKIYNEIIYYAIDSKRASIVQSIVKVALLRGAVPNSKTYSLVLRSNIAHVSRSKDNIDNTMRMLDDILVNRKVDRLGKLDHDLDPLLFKFVIMDIIKFADVKSARKYFDLYIEESKDYLLDNIHILNIELLILGKERRWNEFGACYNRFLDIVVNKMEYSRLKSSDNHSERDRYFPNSDPIITSLGLIDKTRIQASTSPSLKIPSYIKKAHFKVWPLRIENLIEIESVGSLPAEVKSLMEKGIIFSNENLNDVALALSEVPNLIHTAIAFMDEYLLPGTLEMSTRKNQRIKKRWLDAISKEPDHFLIPEMIPKIMKNLMHGFDVLLSPEQCELLYDSIKVSQEKSVLRMLPSFREPYATPFNFYELKVKQEKEFHRRLMKETVSRNKLREGKNIKYRLSKIKYSERFGLLKTMKQKVHDALELGSHDEGLDMSEFSLIEAEVSHKLNLLITEKDRIVDQVKEKSFGDDHEYKVGDLNLYRFNDPRLTSHYQRAELERARYEMGNTQISEEAWPNEHIQETENQHEQ